MYGKKGHKSIPSGAETTKRCLVMTYDKETDSLKVIHRNNVFPDPPGHTGTLTPRHRKSARLAK